MIDSAQAQTQQILKQLENRIKKEYKQAELEVTQKLNDYLRRFAIKDKKWQDWVKTGKKTKKEYQEWRKGQIIVGKRWESLKTQLAIDYANADKIARSIIYGYMPEVYAINHNYATYQVEVGSLMDTSYTLYNRESVEMLLRDNPDLMPPPGRNISAEIAQGKAVLWNKQIIQSVMLQGIIQGDSIPELAKRLASAVADKNFKSAIRNARTMATSALNAGRYDAYKRADKLGIDLTIEWNATLDQRTRTNHRLMHGQRRKVGQPFELYDEAVGLVKILYPADTRGEYKIPQSMIWNCRCTLLAWVKRYEQNTQRTSPKLNGMTYAQWLKAKPKPQRITAQAEKGERIRQRYVNEYRS